MNLVGEGRTSHPFCHHGATGRTLGLKRTFVAAWGGAAAKGLAVTT